MSWPLNVRKQLKDEFIRVQHSFREKTINDAKRVSYFDGRFYLIDTPSVRVLGREEVLGIGSEDRGPERLSVHLWKTAVLTPVRRGLEQDISDAKAEAGLTVTEANIRTEGKSWLSSIVAEDSSGRRIYEDKLLRAGKTHSLAVVARCVGNHKERREILKSIGSIKLGAEE